jgi:hypothetical protein
LGSGVGNLNGNTSGGNQDDFLTSLAGSGYQLADKSDNTIRPYDLSYTATQSGNQGPGTWSFLENFWNNNTEGAIGFKFGTGNKPDEWFVYELQSGVFEGDWSFVNVHGNGGGLSHMMLYGNNIASSTVVSEPEALALLLAGFAGLVSVRRRLK